MRTLQDLLRLQEQFDRAFREARAWRQSPPAVPDFSPPMDVSRSADSYRVALDVAGLSKDDVRVHAESGALVVSGSRQRPTRPDAAVARSERQYGRFSRVVPLPSDADFGQVVARLDKGVLQVTVGRVQPRGPGRVEIPIQ